MRNQEQFQQLAELEKSIQLSLPDSESVASSLDAEARRVREVYGKNTAAKYRMLEQPFMTQFITPTIHRHIAQHFSLSAEDAANCIISEYKLDKIRGIAHPTYITAYPEKHPFKKSIGTTASFVGQSWRSDQAPLSTKHPDLCLRRPFPFLIEAKYFEAGGMQKATTEIARLDYECFFYLGLAIRAELSPPWDYQFACAVIYDQTGHSVREAWLGMDERVRESVWNTANIYVMVLE